MISYVYCPRGEFSQLQKYGALFGRKWSGYHQRSHGLSQQPGYISPPHMGMAQNLRPIGNHRCIGHGKYKGPFLDPMTGLIIHMEHVEHMEDVKQRYPQIHQQLSSITAGGRPTQPSCTRRNSWVTGTKHWTSHPVADGWCIGEFRGAKKVSGII